MHTPEDFSSEDERLLAEPPEVDGETNLRAK